MFVNLPIDINIEIFNLCSYESFSSFAPTCRFALEILDRPEVWKKVCEQNKINVKHECYFGTARSYLSPYWQWESKMIHVSILLTTRPLTTKNNSVRIKVRNQNLKEHMTIGLTDKHGYKLFIATYFSGEGRRAYISEIGKKTRQLSDLCLCAVAPVRNGTIIKFILDQEAKVVSICKDDVLIVAHQISEDLSHLYPYVRKCSGPPLELMTK